MRNIFIDLGANEGQTILHFFSHDWVQNPRDYECFAFEPIHFEQWEKIIEEHPNVQVIEKIAWLYDGTIKLAVHPNTISSSLLPEKVDYTANNLVEYPCIDFSEWIKQFKGEKVILKINIEGGEFELLEKMIADKTISVVTNLYIEWHNEKLGDTRKWTARREKIEADLKSLGINYTKWRQDEMLSLF